MHRRAFIVVTVAVAAFVSASAFDTLAAGSRLVGPRNRSRRPAPTRTYRSYSVSPGTADVPAGPPLGSDPAVVARPAPAPSRRSVPSYMRADSKAQGRFGP